MSDIQFSIIISIICGGFIGLALVNNSNFNELSKEIEVLENKIKRTTL